MSARGLGAKRDSVKPGEEPGDGAQTSRVRGSSRDKTDLQFGAGNKTARGTSASRDKDITGLNRTRGSSKDPADLKFGSSMNRTSSKEKLGLNFGKSAAAAAPLDPSMTTINKIELEGLKTASEENEKHKEELYNLNVKYKKLEFNIEQMKNAHTDELE
jgi:hypothetical protein